MGCGSGSLCWLPDWPGSVSKSRLRLIMDFKMLMLLLKCYFSLFSRWRNHVQQKDLLKNMLTIFMTFTVFCTWSGPKSLLMSRIRSAFQYPAPLRGINVMHFLNVYTGTYFLITGWERWVVYRIYCRFFVYLGCKTFPTQILEILILFYWASENENLCSV